MRDGRVRSELCDDEAVRSGEASGAKTVYYLPLNVHHCEGPKRVHCSVPFS